jgi:hypothetical protein
LPRLKEPRQIQAVLEGVQRDIEPGTRANSSTRSSSRRSAASPSRSDSALQRERRPRGRESPSAVGTRPNLEGGGGQRRGSACGRVNRLFDQLHEACRVVREAAHVARVVELDRRRSSALGHEPLQVRVDARSAPETAYYDGRACQAPDPDGLPKMNRLDGRWSAAISAASFGFKSSGKNCGSTMGATSWADAAVFCGRPPEDGD